LFDNGCTSGAKFKIDGIWGDKQQTWGEAKRGTRSSVSQVRGDDGIKSLDSLLGGFSTTKKHGWIVPKLGRRHRPGTISIGGDQRSPTADLLF